MVSGHPDMSFPSVDHLKHCTENSDHGSELRGIIFC